MLKRILKIGMIASVMMCSFTAFAQEEQPAPKYQYPNYGFWSNWSLGVNGGATLNLDHSELNPETQPSWGVGLILSKELNYVWNLRLQGNLHNIKNGMGKSLSMTVGFDFSIIDAIKGYNPERVWKLYLIGNAGMGIDKSGVIVEDYGKTYYLASAGLGVSYRFAERWIASLEGSAYLPADLGSPFSGGFKGYYAYVSLGLAYDFGVTATDKARIAQEAMLTQENFDALTQERDQAKSELDVAKKSERALQEKVAKLETAQANNERIAKNEAELAKLREQLDQIKKEQLNFYALPLSILYGVDQYRVPANEMKKMKAIARVMKDNPDYKFTIVGFADYTGSAEYNQKLSEKRAEEAKKVLVNKYGIAEDRLIIAGKGQGDSFGDVKMSINRRVSFYRVIE